MQKLVRRLALLMALLMALAGAAAALAEDWRSQLRELYGLSDDYDGGEGLEQPTPQPTAKPKGGKNKAKPTARPTDGPLFELPENFITKDEAKALGWDSRYNYVGEVAPGKSIGGDRFGNYEGLLPEAPDRFYTECDIDTLGAKKRGAKRIVFSNDGLIYYTDDHYEHFTLLYGEE